MRSLALLLSLPSLLIVLQSNSIAIEYQSSSSPNRKISSSTQSNFYTVTAKLLQDQINLVARIEKAMLIADPNRMRVVRGQLLHQSKLVERLLEKYSNKAVVSSCQSVDKLKSDVSNFSPYAEVSQRKIYCALSAYNQSLLKLAPILDRLLSRRGESAMVRDLPLVTGERVFHPVLSISKVSRPQLGNQATPFATLEPELLPPLHQTIGRKLKKTVVNYHQPLQPAIAKPPETFAIFNAINQTLDLAKNTFPSDYQFYDPKETDVALNTFAYDLDPQESQTHAEFLKIPSTGIFRALHRQTYIRELNYLQNRLLKKNIKSLRESSTVISNHYHGNDYLFPTLNKSKSGFISILPLQIVNGLPSESNSIPEFGVLGKGIDYSFIIDIGDIPLESLETNLQKIPPQVRNFVLNYQPPKQLADIQIDKRRFFTSKYPVKGKNLKVSTTLPAKLNHTYVARIFQFQLPKVILTGEIVPQSQRGYLDKLLETQSSDLIVAFRPVRQRSDGSYTVLWRVIKQFDSPQITDLENHLRYY